MYIEVPESLFLNRWWEVAMRVVIFLLGMSYSAIFGQIFNQDTYLALPLLTIAVGIMLGRHVAMSRWKEYEKKKAIAEIMEFEMQHQRQERMRIEMEAKRPLELELEKIKRELRQAMMKIEEMRPKNKDKL